MKHINLKLFPKLSSKSEKNQKKSIQLSDKDPEIFAHFLTFCAILKAHFPPSRLSAITSLWELFRSFILLFVE